MKKSIYFFLVVVIFTFLNTAATAQELNKMVRIAKLEIDSTQLEPYKVFLKEEIEASIKLEKGVLSLYAVFEINKPNQLTILEIYADKNAYQKHIQTPHFKKYKEATKLMVKSIELTEANPLIPNMKIK